MQKITLLLLMTIPFLSCHNNDVNSASKKEISERLSAASEAKSDYDASNYGVYKGIFIGSSGTIYVNIHNDGSVFAKMVIDGISYKFTAKETITEGKAITNLTFSDEKSSFDFSVQADGENPLVSNIKITGHPDSHVQIFKEYSFAHIKCYLGTFTGAKGGIFNLATTSDGYALGLAVAKEDSTAIYMDGSIDNETIQGSYEGGQFSATIKNNKVTGSWQNETQQKGTWEATRKL